MNQLRQEVVRAGWRMAHRSPIIWRGIIDHKAGTAITPGHLSKPKPTSGFPPPTRVLLLTANKPPAWRTALLRQLSHHQSHNPCARDQSKHTSTGRSFGHIEGGEPLYPDSDP